MFDFINAVSCEESVGAVIINFISAHRLQFFDSSTQRLSSVDDVVHNQAVIPLHIVPYKLDIRILLQKLSIGGDDSKSTLDSSPEERVSELVSLGTRTDVGRHDDRVVELLIGEVFGDDTRWV